MTFFYYGVGAGVAALTVGVGLALRKWLPTKINVYFKTTAMLLLAALFFRYMWYDDNLQNIQNLTVGYGFTSKAAIVLAFVQVSLAYAAEMLTIFAPFFKLKTLPALVTFFGGAAYLLNFAAMPNHIMGIVGQTALEAIDFRATLIAVETGLGVGFTVVYAIQNRDKIILHGKDWAWFAAAIVGMLLATTPCYTFQLFFDTAKYAYHPLDLNQTHRLLLYPAFLLPVVMYLVLKDLPDESKRFALLYYAWMGLLNFSLEVKFNNFSGNQWVTAFPLHLCCTAMYVTPLCLTFKWKKLFYFTYFINVLGAFLALAMPNYGDGATVFSQEVWRFYFNHYQAFFMPLLIVGLGMFRRPRWKEFGYSMVAFAVYFVAMLVINAWFSNYNPDVNYFFLNNDFIPKKFGVWGESLLNVKLEFDLAGLHFKFYPLYQFLFFLVYFAAAFGMWFLYELGYSVISNWQDMAARSKKISADRLALEVSLAGRSIEEPMNKENENKLLLKDFTKRYGNSDVYAVRKANLEVDGGQIFGFLGPNGAGKSTIIKSIVGIQTITDGAIEVCGYDVATQSVQAKRQIGFVPDHYALYERLTAREYINYIADLYEVSQEDRDKRLADFIQRFEFQSAIDTPIKTYSHGMKQKVTIMAALIHDPKVWILDEPLTGLDPNSIYQVKECMKAHAAKGNIVFFSSHIIDVVERICDKIAIIRKGQIQCVRDVHQMEADGENLEEFYMQVINGHDVQPIAVEGVAAK